MAGVVHALTAPDTTAAPVTQSAQWLDLPQSVFIEVGRQANGGLDMARMLSAWKQAGMTEQQELEVIPRLADLAPTLVAVKEPGLVERLQSRAQAAATDLQQDYPQVAQRLAKGSQVQADPYLWPSAQQLLAWQADAPSLVQASGAPFEFTRAQRNLSAAVAQTGLAVLHVPIAAWSHPGQLQATADHLHTANADLQRATGWDQGVLGLGGRVHLTLGNPGAISSERGSTVMGWKGDLSVVAARNALGHEWSHALDFVVAQHAYANPLPRTMSGQDGWLRWETTGDTVSHWSEHQAALRQAAPHWTAANQSRLLNRLYLSNPSEMNARAFAAFLNVDANALGMGALAPSPRMPATFYPQGDEAYAANAALSRLFSDLAPLKLSATAHAPVREAERFQRAQGQPALPPLVPADETRGISFAEGVGQMEDSLRQAGVPQEQIDEIMSPMRQELAAMQAQLKPTASQPSSRMPGP